MTDEPTLDMTSQLEALAVAAAAVIGGDSRKWEFFERAVEHHVRQSDAFREGVAEGEREREERMARSRADQEARWAADRAAGRKRCRATVIEPARASGRRHRIRRQCNCYAAKGDYLCRAHQQVLERRGIVVNFDRTDPDLPVGATDPHARGFDLAEPANG